MTYSKPEAYSKLGYIQNSDFGCEGEEPGTRNFDISPGGFTVVLPITVDFQYFLT